MNQKFQITESADLLKILQALVANQQALAEALGLVLPADLTWLTMGNDDATSSAKDQLPKRLSARLLSTEALENAFSRGYLVWTGNKLQWTLPSKTLLAYFLGRLFCGDKSRFLRARHAYIWIQGKSVYPDAELTALFGYSVRTARVNRKNLTTPEKSQLIDNLFLK